MPSHRKKARTASERFQAKIRAEAARLREAEDLKKGAMPAKHGLPQTPFRTSLTRVICGWTTTFGTTCGMFNSSAALSCGACGQNLPGKFDPEPRRWRCKCGALNFSNETKCSIEQCDREAPWLDQARVIRRANGRL